ncbi:hypothetical protein M0D21_18055 [Aquimarina sp. D1M17]|uniref:hypothetical protein n=1 Tax=Aquimarina acroporae TaxID=2937283 RepID=UPI0020BDDC95|nr:hypothetical protein [Aquimarina acroporae]MCK8523492.1 hypothetical protein [Aquimarina acroporae]
MNDILKLARIQIVLIVLFIFFKFIRPSIIEGNYSEWIKITLLSLPNFFEGIIGVLILTGLGLYLNIKVFSPDKQIGTKLVYAVALILAGIYVLTQEFKIHNLGGNNVFDKNDVIFSIVGLIIGYSIVRIIKPVVNRTI